MSPKCIDKKLVGSIDTAASNQRYVLSQNYLLYDDGLLFSPTIQQQTHAPDIYPWSCVWTFLYSLVQCLVHSLILIPPPCLAMLNIHTVNTYVVGIAIAVMHLPASQTDSRPNDFFKRKKVPHRIIVIVMIPFLRSHSYCMVDVLVHICTGT